MASKANKKERDAGEVGPPATKDQAVNKLREEERNKVEKKEADDDSGLKPSGGSGTDSPLFKTRKAPLKIGTWNVRTLFQAGKFDNLLLEMKDLNMDIMGVAESRLEVCTGRVSPARTRSARPYEARTRPDPKLLQGRAARPDPIS